MNTPSDASDTAINRLVDFETNYEETAREVRSALSEYDRQRDESTAKQLADVEKYAALNLIELSDTMKDFVRMCLACAYADGYHDGSNR